MKRGRPRDPNKDITPAMREIMELRMSLSKTQKEFGELLGVTAATVKGWETGHRKPDRRSRMAIEKLREEIDE